MGNKIRYRTLRKKRQRYKNLKSDSKQHKQQCAWNIRCCKRWEKYFGSIYFGSIHNVKKRTWQVQNKRVSIFRIVTKGSPFTQSVVFLVSRVIMKSITEASQSLNVTQPCDPALPLLSCRSNNANILQKYLCFLAYYCIIYYSQHWKKKWSWV